MAKSTVKEASSTFHLEPSHAVVIENSESDKFTLLAAALDKSKFWEQIEHSWKKAGMAKSDFTVIVVPDLGQFNSFPSTITDPALVEHLIDLLNEHQFTNVIIGGTTNSSGRSWKTEIFTRYRTLSVMDLSLRMAMIMKLLI